MSRVESHFEVGQYAAVIAVLDGAAQGARENALLGLALLRSGRLPEAEFPLARASMLGDAEGRVEYGNLLRLLGRFDEACAHLEDSADDLTGELQLRCLRWWGVAEFQLGRAEPGLRRVERAWHGYLALDDAELSARVTQSLAAMYLRVGDRARAKLLFKEAARALPMRPVPLPLLGALHGLLDIQLHEGDFAGAKETLREAKRALLYTDSPREHAMILSAEAELYRLTGQQQRYLDALERLMERAEDAQDFELRVWTLSRLVDRLSFLGQHGRATQLLIGFGTAPEKWPPELWAAQGLLKRRRELFAEAELDLVRAADAFRVAGRTPELIRALLHAAAAALHDGPSPRTEPYLKEALFEMLRLKTTAAYQSDFEELSELLHFAMLEPDLAPLMEPVLDNLAHLAGAPRLEEDGAMHLQLTTLGRVAVYKDGSEVALSLKGSALLLVYLALQPGRTRAEIQLALYPDKEANTGAGYVRSAIAELREKLGRDVITYEGPHNAPWYRLGQRVQLDLDLTRFHDALKKGELARALALYRGEFMPGADDGEWAIHLRETALLALTYELRDQLSRHRSEGDYRRVILLANQLLRVDPYDQEVLEARLSAARIVASSHEVAKYAAELKRMYN